MLLAALAATGAVVLTVALATPVARWSPRGIGTRVFDVLGVVGVFSGSLLIGWLLRRWMPAAPLGRVARRTRLRAELARAAVHRRRVRRMSARSLGERWAASAVALTHEPSPAGRARVAARRAEYLSEMERRDPAGFARWMAEDPLATDPRGYLAPQGR